MPSRRVSIRVWWYRGLAVVGVPALLLLGLEGALRLIGAGRNAHFLIPDDQPGYYRSNPDFVSLFMPGSFDLRPLNFRVAVRKPADTVRIVVLGESATEGVPAPPFAFAPQLRAQLRARYPAKRFEVLNTGIVAVNSHVVDRVARDLARFSPDLFVVYLGNNEVVGPYGPGCTYLSAMPPLWAIRLSVFVRSTRTGQLLGGLLGKLAPGGPAADWGGMSMFVDSAVAGDDPRLEAVYRNFEANLTDIVRVAADAGAKTLLCTVVSNLKDCAPLWSRHRPGLSAADLAAWQKAFDGGTLAWRLGDAAAARPELQEALRLDPQYADAAYLLGRLELQAGETAAARAHLVQAEHWDALRFRPDPRINDVIRRVARRFPAVALLDAARLMGSDPDSPGPPAGHDYLFEHVHLNWAGNYFLARRMAEESATLLFGRDSGTGGWLEPAGCAAALGYSAHEVYPVLARLASIVIAPPFTHQLTYVEDQARLARDLATAKAERARPERVSEARALVRAAAAADPENADLAKIEEELDDEAGDLAGALAQAQRAQTLQPANFALAGDEAIKLARLGRFAEAERLLRKTSLACTPRDRALLAPAFADLFTRTQRFVDGRKFLDDEIARQPASVGLRLLRGRLAWLGGDAPAAERDFRSILRDDPAGQEAAEALFRLLADTGRTAEAEAAALATVPHQPRNQANNLRAAIIYEQRHDETNAIRCLVAAERSGPVNSGLELHLARQYFGRHRVDAALTHLAEARRISRYEGDPAATADIDRIIAQVRARQP